ncbi:hypothetical protein IC615_27705 [Serratia ureilytica]
MRQFTAYGAIIDKVTGYLGIAIDNTAVVVGQRAAIQTVIGLPLTSPALLTFPVTTALFSSVVLVPASAIVAPSM